MKTFRKVAIATVIAGPLTAAMATNGYFSHGYGMKAKGMAGAAVASTDNAFAGANNPATAAWAGNRVDVGIDFFMPERSMDRSSGGSYKSESTLFYVPEFGYNRAIDEKMGVGVTVYGNGGMNTNYPVSGTNPFNGNGRLGVDLTQLIVAPTFAYKLNPSHSMGVSPLLIQQQFKAQGLDGFGIANDTGYDTSNGVGIRIGYLGKISNVLSVGASYSPKTKMSKFDKYKGLFAEQGGFDIPENYTLGMSMQATPDVLVALDYQRISYGGVRSIANPSNGGTLGADDGKGFGWKSIDVWKLGAEWKTNASLTLRAGLNVGDNPIKSADASFNTLAPGVVTVHYTLGGTYALSKSSELTVAYMNAPSNSVTGQNQGGSFDTIKMSQQSLGVQFGWKY